MSVHDLFDRLDDIRTALGSTQALAVASQVPSDHYVGLDGVVREALKRVLFSVNDLPAADVRVVRGDVGIPGLASRIRQYGPPAIAGKLIDRLEFEFHHRRNLIEHSRLLVSARETFEFIEAVEALLYAIAEPPAPAPPPEIFGADIESLTQHVLTRGLLGRPWVVAHGRPNDPGNIDQHMLAFARWDGAAWERPHIEDLGAQYAVTIRRIATRSAAHEEILVWRRFGESMGRMAYDVFGFDDGVPKALLSREGPGMYVDVRGDSILESAGGRQLRFRWDGNGYIGERVLQARSRLLGTVTVSYSVDSIGQVSGPTTVALRQGQRLQLVRDDLQMTVVRELYDASGVIESNADGTYEAIAIGETQIQLIPDVYDWDRSLTIQIVVQAAD